MGVYVYMVRCADGSYYVGSATGEDLAPRIDQHNAGAYPGYTFTRRPVVLVWSERFERITDGIAVERQIKGWGRAKKEALIRWIGRPSAGWLNGAAAWRASATVNSSRLIPFLIDQNLCAHWRNPMDMIFQGRSTSAFQAWQQ
jgi:putative endonuclease